MAHHCFVRMSYSAGELVEVLQRILSLTGVGAIWVVVDEEEANTQRRWAVNVIEA